MSKNVRLSFVAFVCGGFAAPYAHAQFGAGPANLELAKLADDLYAITNPFVPGVTTALITNDGVLLVDDKFEVDHENIMRLLATVTSAPVKYVINTHHHGDHSGGNAKLQAQGALAVASDRARARMVAGNQPGLPDVTVDDGGAIHLGGKRVEIHWLGRGHTDGDVVVLFPDHRVLAAGDLYTNGEDTPQLIDYGGGGSAMDWTATIDRVLELPFDTVVPGHGRVVPRSELQKFRESTVRLVELPADLVRQGKSRAEIEAVMRSEFGWQDLHVQFSLDGLINEIRSTR